MIKTKIKILSKLRENKSSREMKINQIKTIKILINKTITITINLKNSNNLNPKKDQHLLAKGQFQQKP